MKKNVSCILMFMVCCLFSGCCINHEWKEATCAEPKTCTVCGETQGENLEHEWKEATCTEPKKCAVCGEMQGEALEHEWQEATCTEPKKCVVCGEMQGETLEHEWKEATYKEPKTCSLCGVTDGEPLEFTAEFLEEEREYVWKLFESDGEYGMEVLVQVKGASNVSGSTIYLTVTDCIFDYKIFEEIACDGEVFADKDLTPEMVHPELGENAVWGHVGDSVGNTIAETDTGECTLSFIYYNMGTNEKNTYDIIWSEDGSLRVSNGIIEEK